MHANKNKPCHAKTIRVQAKAENLFRIINTLITYMHNCACKVTGGFRLLCVIVCDIGKNPCANLCVYTVWQGLSPVSRGRSNDLFYTCKWRLNIFENGFVCRGQISCCDEFEQKKKIQILVARVYLGSMLWSQFSAIFDNFRRKNWRFSQKPMLWSQFLQKLAVVWAKNFNIFAKIFGENI
jgi:hypothetical protein